jgi:hypothetical protein
VAKKNTPVEQPAGPASDAQGRTVIDPTRNVLDLVEAAVKRQDDLRKVEAASIKDQLEVRQSARERELEASIKLVNTRLEGMDKATDLRLAAINNVPDLIEAAVSHIEHLMDEKLNSIDLRFIERDTRTSQAAETSQKALDAALLAAAALVNQQNEANATAATVQTLSFTKQIDQIIVLTERQQKSSDDRLAELKERIDRGDGSSAGIRDSRTDSRASNSQVVALIVAVLFMMQVGLALFIAFKKP